MLARALAKGNGEEAQGLFNRALEMCLLLALPAAVALAVIPHALITVLFERGEFTAADTDVTTLVLMCYAIGLPAYIAVKVFSTAHWARQDTVTPVKIAVKATVVNILLSLVFIQFIGVAGIALATGLAGWMQFVMHMRALKGHAAVRFDERFKAVLPKIVISTCIMAAVLFIVSGLIENWIYDEHTLFQILALLALVLAGLMTYGFAVFASGILKFQDIKGYLTRRSGIPEAE